MKPPFITVQLPDGSSVSIEQCIYKTNTNLAEFLEQNDLNLNTRCGGRGLCRGCEVINKTDDTNNTIRSCQTKLDTFTAEAITLQIPLNSWQNKSLYGVSCFEIRLPLAQKQTTSKALGLALDVGTTTLAGALWDLSSGQCLAHGSIANPQRKFGDNVLARISYSIDKPKGIKQLQSSLVKDGLVPLITTLLRQANRSSKSIEQATFAGNPVMLHTVLGLSLVGLSKYPFKPEFLDSRCVTSTEIGLQYDFTIRLLPSLGPFVGADITAGALASGMLVANGPTLLIDFGTNGEILIKHNGRYLATATAAGPAFEGGRLSCGASAHSGVISSLQYNESKWSYTLCEGEATPPKGISGAAYIDFIALGLESGLLNAFGRFNREHIDVSILTIDDDQELIVRLTPTIYISESDVAEILQAKAAIGAGVQVLLELSEIEASDLQTVFVAGGFGYHLNPAHAIAIGLLPNVSLESVDTIGNASLGGASMSLQADYNEDIEILTQRCKIIELNEIPSFSDHYTDAMLLEPIE